MSAGSGRPLRQRSAMARSCLPRSSSCLRSSRPRFSSASDWLVVAASTQQERRSPNLDVLILGGRPIREPVAWMGPFVMNTREEVLQAVADYQAGRLGSIPAVHNTPTTLVQTDRTAAANDPG